MPDEDVLVGIVSLSLFLLAVIVGTFLYRWYRKDHVWVEVDLKTGRTKKKLIKPDLEGVLHTRKGAYFVRADAYTLYKKWGDRERPLFRYTEGNSHPITYRELKFIAKKPVEMVSTNPGETVSYKKGDVVRIPMARYETMPAESQEVFMKQHLFADAFGGKPSLILIVLVAGVAFLFGVVAATYSR